MALREEPKIYTCEDYYNLPEGTRAELIEGMIIYNMAPPSGLHQKISLILSTRIFQYIESKNGKCEVYTAPYAVQLSEENNSIVEPDISVICDSNKISNKGCSGAPDFIIEIVSPSNKSHDYVTKLNLYHKYGVKEYWIVDPIQEKVVVCQFSDDIIYTSFSFNDKIKVNIFDDLYIDFSEIKKSIQHLL